MVDNAVDTIWIKEEDDLLVDIRLSNPAINYQRISLLLPGRSASACKHRLEYLSGYRKVREDHSKCYYVEEIADIFDVTIEYVISKISINCLVVRNKYSDRADWKVTAVDFRDYLRTYSRDLQELSNKGHHLDMITIIEVLAGVKSKYNSKCVNGRKPKGVNIDM